MPAFETLAKGLFERGQIHVHGRPADAEVRAEALGRIEERWREYERQAKEQGSSLFNGLAAHLQDWKVIESADPRQRELHLYLAPTDYKTFLVTVLRDREWFQAHAPRAMTPALGNSILLTHGNQVLLGVRSAKVAAYAHHAHLIGGVLDRIPAAETTGDATMLLEHLYEELREELSLLSGELAGVPRALGLFRDLHLAQPELVWHGELAVPPDQVVERHANDEHSSLWAGPLSEAIGQLVNKLTPVAAAACRLALAKSS